MSKPSTKSATITGPKLTSTLNGLAVEARTRSVATLNQVLAELIDLHSQTKQAHWNVAGSAFYSQHKLFDDLAESVFEPIDDVAERIVQLGGTAGGTIRQAASTSSLPEFPTDTKGGLTYVTALAERYANLGNSVRKAIDSTANAGDADTADLLTGLSRTLDKALWFLEAHTRA
ncbi:MAG: DNA starvation/stationary phase protection protein Dps [Puniceicoccales bacterium]|jgi:starvation-inducible DNA-binding protein|nr:DNA starvation/stationary phase protection protein Dps [Puniceicoccales bacterium]